ncbi:hypothetical protein [Meiothermus sp. Pnk-1]|uniref:hypothetical protein n=1 Tax=Meiothermus sp. Pnk-1 TaxID=873128 RepID=UPI000D7CBC3E|nr:hypothetical protein [Meiothermus sp. Pnk-1]PZA06931.1 hypothetical protein DNA98_09655 [Meiothermus sp. Pnk-1]
MTLMVLGASARTAKDGRRFGKVLVATTPTDAEFRGMNVLELDADPDVVATMPTFPGLYDLQIDLRVRDGFREKNSARQFVTVARFVAPLAPVKEKA